jgi:hypothetical protein
VVNLREKVAWFDRRNGKSHAIVTEQPSPCCLSKRTAKINAPLHI